MTNPDQPDAAHLIGERTTLTSLDPADYGGTVTGVIAAVEPGPPGETYAVAVYEAGHRARLPWSLIESTRPVSVSGGQPQPGTNPTPDVDRDQTVRALGEVIWEIAKRNPVKTGPSAIYDGTLGGLLAPTQAEFATEVYERVIAPLLAAVRGEPQRGDIWRIGTDEAALVWVRAIVDPDTVDVIPLSLDPDLENVGDFLIPADESPYGATLAVLGALRAHVHRAAFINRVGTALEVTSRMEEVVFDCRALDRQDPAVRAVGRVVESAVPERFLWRGEPQTPQPGGGAHGVWEGRIGPIEGYIHGPLSGGVSDADAVLLATCPDAATADRIVAALSAAEPAPPPNAVAVVDGRHAPDVDTVRAWAEGVRLVYPGLDGTVCIQPGSTVDRHGATVPVRTKVDPDAARRFARVILAAADYAEGGEPRG
jgi:hypothetical protein